MNFDRSIFIGRFTQEAKDLVQALNAGLIELENDPGRHEIIRDIMRAAHTLKGSSKLMHFNNVSQLAHKMEDLLTSVQEGRIQLTGDVLDLLFTSTDLMNQGIDAILQGQGDQIAIEAACEMLDRAVQGDDISSLFSQQASAMNAPAAADERESGGPSARDSAMEQQPTEEAAPQDQPAAEPSSDKPKFAETIRIGVDSLDNVIRLIGEVAVSHRKTDQTLTGLKELYRTARKHAKHLQLLLQQNGSGLAPEVKTELVQASQRMSKGIEQIFKDNRDEMAVRDLVITELYEDALSMRMLPLATIFDSFPRAVRDMAKQFQKQIVLRINGENTTLDKKIIEKLNAPLIHLLRNSIDHGIESPEERIAQSKSPTGLITISARQKSGHIEIAVTDDGRGVHTEKLVQRLVARGIVADDTVETLSDSDLVNLIFLPGVSTSDIITDISGRGVGMDIVKAAIEELKGTVTFSSTSGQGSRCVLTVPTTLISLRCLIIASRNQLLAVPINMIEETLQVQAHEFIEVVGQCAIRRRNQIIYVVDLADLLHLPGRASHGPARYFLLITRSHGKRIGLIVHEILDEQDVVIKQLPTHMQHVKTIAGATISTDNTIILILHIPEIVKLVKQATVSSSLQRQQPQEAAVAAPTILVVDDSMNTREIEKTILEANGYAVNLAKDGTEALEQLEKMPCDLIVTDIEMPHMDGFTLTEHVRQIPQYAHIPIVIVTSLERQSDKKRGIQVGADAYILKSDFEQKNLLETVNSLIGF
jgi:two-component system, chemotaxis family, sensor kinase CheA